MNKWLLTAEDKGVEEIFENGARAGYRKGTWIIHNESRPQFYINNGRIVLEDMEYEYELLELGEPYIDTRRDIGYKQNNNCVHVDETILEADKCTLEEYYEMA